MHQLYILLLYTHTHTIRTNYTLQVEDDGIDDSIRLGMKINRSTDDIPDAVDFTSKPPSGAQGGSRTAGGSIGGALGGSMGGALGGSMGGALSGSMGGALSSLTGAGGGGVGAGGMGGMGGGGTTAGGLSKSGSIGSALHTNLTGKTSSALPAHRSNQPMPRSKTTDSISSKTFVKQISDNQ